MTAQPGEVYLADIFEGGVRPVVIVSREQRNRGPVMAPGELARRDCFVVV